MILYDKTNIRVVRSYHMTGKSGARLLKYHHVRDLIHEIQPSFTYHFSFLPALTLTWTMFHPFLAGQSSTSHIFALTLESIRIASRPLTILVGNAIHNFPDLHAMPVTFTMNESCSSLTWPSMRPSTIALKLNEFPTKTGLLSNMVARSVRLPWQSMVNRKSF